MRKTNKPYKSYKTNKAGSQNKTNSLLCALLFFSVRDSASLVVLSFALLLSVPFDTQAANRVKPSTRDKLQRELPILNLSIGDPVLIRTFKKESRLELWIKPQGQANFLLFRTYPICFYSGGLGPKHYAGDKVTPEGFYRITRRGLNPRSRFHLSLNIGYPNAYDQWHGRSGSLLMIHGACDSVGCFAMGNDQIEEIYYLVEQALNNGQAYVPVHAFPFHMSNDNLEHYRTSRWYGFWTQLKAGYETFNAEQVPPIIAVERGRYTVRSGR